MSPIPIRDDAHWRQLRAAHIGGSEVAALFGEHPHLTRFELWHRKAGNISEPDLSDNERVTWGQLVEPAIGEGVRRLKGWSVEKPDGYHKHPTIRGLGATLDFVATDGERGPGAMDAKNVDRLVVLRDWTDATPPLWHMLQVQHQLACTGWAWGANACLVGGNELKVFEYERRPKIIAAIEREVAAFWDSIDLGIPPKPDFEADLSTIQTLHREAGGGFLDLTADNEPPDLCARYQDATAAEKAARADKDAIKAEILTKIGVADKALVAGGYSVSAKEVGEAEISYTRKPYRAFSIHKKKDEAA